MAALLLLAACAAPRVQLSPLVEAARAGDVATVRSLCARGASPDAPSGENGWTPLMHAIHKGRTRTVAALLDAGAQPDLAAPNHLTPLMMAAGYGQRESVALLLRHGARPDVRDLDGAVALDYALTGLTDIDDFTFFGCHDDTTAMLREVSPQPQKSSLRWAKMKGCA